MKTTRKRAVRPPRSTQVTPPSRPDHTENPANADEEGPRALPDPPDGLVDRRGLLAKLGGATVAGAGLAVVGQALAPRPAVAANGDPVILGQVNQEGSPTKLYLPLGYPGDPGFRGAALDVSLSGVTSPEASALSASSDFSTALHARSGGAGGNRGCAGVRGENGTSFLPVSEVNAGVLGESLSFDGVLGVSASYGGQGVGVHGRITHSGAGTGVLGETSGGTAVHGRETSGIGVLGTSDSNHAVRGIRGGPVSRTPPDAAIWGGSGTSDGVAGTSGSGAAVTGSSDSGLGVRGSTSTGPAGVRGSRGLLSGVSRQAGVWGDSNADVGVAATSNTHYGVQAQTTSGRAAVYGARGKVSVFYRPAALWGDSSSGDAVPGTSDTGARLWTCGAGPGSAAAARRRSPRGRLGFPLVSVLSLPTHSSSQSSAAQTAWSS